MLRRPEPSHGQELSIDGHQRGIGHHGGGEPACDFRLAYRGAKKLLIDKNGNLMIRTSLGNISDTRPTTYQWIDGKRVEVPSRFALDRRSKVTY